MTPSETKLLPVRLPEAEKRRIKIMAASQGVTIRQAIHEAFDARAAQLQSRASTPDAARGTPAATDSATPRLPNQPATPRQDPRPAEAKPSSTPGGGPPPNAEAPSIDWLRRVAQLDWSKCPEAQRVVGKDSNVWVVRGTRVPVSAVLDAIAEGYPPVEVAEVFEFSLQRLITILQFAAEGAAPAGVTTDAQRTQS